MYPFGFVKFLDTQKFVFLFVYFLWWQDPVICLVGTKADLISEKVVSDEEVSCALENILPLRLSNFVRNSTRVELCRLLCM